MKRLATAAIAAAMSVPLAAQAQGAEDFYIAASVAQWEVNRNASGALHPSAATLTLGKSFGSNLAVEVSGGSGVSGDGRTVGTSRVSAEAKEFAAVHVRPYLRVAGDRLEYYARFGVYHGRLGGRCGCSNGSAPRDDISYGLGMAILLTGSTAIVADLMQYYDRNDVTIRAVNVGLRVGF